MTITYPLALPSVNIRGIRLYARNVVGVGQSPFTLTPQVQQHQGQRWEADIELPPLFRADDAEEWICFLQKLKGSYGTFLLRDTVSGTPRGAWAGSPLVVGAHAAQASAVNLDGLTAATTIKAGDYVQFGTGASSRLHKVLSDVTADGSGLATIDIWPNLREGLADNAAIVTSNAVGTFRLASNAVEWDIGIARVYGLRFAAVEAL